MKNAVSVIWRSVGFNRTYVSKEIITISKVERISELVLKKAVTIMVPSFSG
jgi:hypothetical protein